MRLTDNEIMELAGQVDNLWKLNGTMFCITWCSTCRERHQCLCRLVGGTSLCSECYLEERIAEREQERLNLDLKDFASI